MFATRPPMGWHRLSVVSLLAALPLLLHACGGEPAQEAETVLTGPPVVIEVTDAGFSVPESMLHDGVADVYLVSNINGSALEADGNGFISRVAPSGEVLELKWIDGEAEGVTLNGPKGMAIVGDKFSRMEYYLPELIRCADAMKAAMDVLKPHLGKGQDGGVQGTVVIGTIQGDLHDLGKNIVKTMLQAAAFTVHDLGCDVQVRSFIDKAEEQDVDVIAASAILTTTMAYMPDLVNLLSDMNLRDRFKVMVGGAPVTPEYADEAGADGYGENAAEAVETAKRLVQSRRGGA